MPKPWETQRTGDAERYSGNSPADEGRALSEVLRGPETDPGPRSCGASAVRDPLKLALHHGQNHMDLQ